MAARMRLSELVRKTYRTVIIDENVGEVATRSNRCWR
jgi:hypothetical protein